MKAIAVGGLLVAILDLSQAMILFGPRVPLVVAAGLLGRRAFHGGASVYILGIVLILFIAFCAATIYFALSRRLRFLIEHPLVCGLAYGALFDELMNLVVLPLSALQARGPFRLHDLLLGLIVHSVIVGLPISFSVRRFAS